MEERTEKIKKRTTKLKKRKGGNTWNIMDQVYVVCMCVCERERQRECM